MKKIKLLNFLINKNKYSSKEEKTPENAIISGVL